MPASLGRDTLHNGPYQPLPGILRRLDGDVPSESGHGFRRHGTQRGQSELTTDQALSGYRQSAASRVAMAELVRVIQSTVPDAIRSAMSAGRASASAFWYTATWWMSATLRALPGAVPGPDQREASSIPSARAGMQRLGKGFRTIRVGNQIGPQMITGQCSVPVPGPIAASFKCPIARRSPPRLINRSRKKRTPLPDVNTIHSNSGRRPIASSSGPGSATGKIWTVGASKTSAPSDSNPGAIRTASSIGRVTTIRCPNKGSDSYHDRSLRRSTTDPTTSRAGG